MIEIVPEIGSTNAELVSRIAAGEGVGEGQWLIADRQTAGKGRAGRSWSDGAGNFMGSSVVRLLAGDPPAQTLALVAGLALHRTVGTWLKRPQLMLKWPNDLLLDGVKLAGILLERREDAVVVGIGVNLAQAPDLADRRTTCLADEGLAVSRNEFAEALADEWALAIVRWHRGEWHTLREEWLTRAHPVGTLVSVKDRDLGELIGSFAGIDGYGVACLRLADGTTRAIHAGDIEMVG